MQKKYKVNQVPIFVKIHHIHISNVIITIISDVTMTIKILHWIDILENKIFTEGRRFCHFGKKISCDRGEVLS